MKESDIVRNSHRDFQHPKSPVVKVALRFLNPPYSEMSLCTTEEWG